MCAYYENGTDRIRRGDTARYLDKPITILEAKHIKASRTMRIVYRANDQAITLNVPYDTVIDAMHLIARADKTSEEEPRKRSATQKPTPRINEMGQEVVEGYACKPVDYDPQRPIMHYRYQLYLCDDERCRKAAGEDKAKRLRDLLKAMGLNQGNDRIKISRSRCQGACRYRQVAQLNANTRANGLVENNALWLRHVHRLSDQGWRRLFEELTRGAVLTQILDPKHFIPMKVYGEPEVQERQP